MGTASGRDIHVDRPLSNLAVKAFDGAVGFIAGQVFPSVRVSKQSDKYYILDKDAWLRSYDTLRSPKTAPKNIEFKVTSESYFADNHALRGSNAFEDLANQDEAIMLRETTTENVTEALLRGLEIRVANKVTSGTNLGSYVSLSGATLWSDFVNSDPIADVTTGHAFIRQNTGLMANTMIVDEDTLKVVRRHPLLLDLFKYTSGGMLERKELMDVFGVSNILVGTGIKNNALGGATASITNIWGNNVVLASIVPGTSRRTKTFGLGFQWRPAGFSAPMQVMRYDAPDKGEHFEYIEASYFQDEKIVGQDLSYGIMSTL